MMNNRKSDRFYLGFQYHWNVWRCLCSGQLSHLCGLLLCSIMTSHNFIITRCHSDVIPAQPTSTNKVKHTQKKRNNNDLNTQPYTERHTGADGDVTLLLVFNIRWISQNMKIKEVKNKSFVRAGFFTELLQIQDVKSSPSEQIKRTPAL